MNNFLIRASITIGILMLFSWAMLELGEVDFVPWLNVFVKNYLYIPGILFSVALYLLIRDILLDSLALRVIMIYGLVFCVLQFFMFTWFNGRYNETQVLILNKEQKLYVSKVNEHVFMSGRATHFKIYRNEFPFSNTIREMYTMNISLIGEDSSYYILQGSTEKGMDTLYVPKKTRK